jgi:SAM-dependent methyltransferase
MDNVQTFSTQSDCYARHRPTYPPELFAYLAGIARQRRRALDVATGNGQAAVACAAYFEHVDASDISPAQIENAFPHPRVTYHVLPAEQTPFEDGAFDLITVALALHWLDLDRFYGEALRLLAPEGILAVWAYGFFKIEPALDAIIDRSLLAPIDPFWAEGNRIMFTGYHCLPFPFDEICDLPDFAMSLDWNLGQLLAFLRTWSAVKRYATEVGSDPVEQLENDLLPAWGAPEATKPVKLPLYLRVGRKPA